MMLTIHGLPLGCKYHDLKLIIKQECNLSDFILDNLVGDGDSSKKVRIGVADESEGSHLIKCLDGYRMGANVLRVLPVAKAGRSRITPEQRRLMLEFIKANPVMASGRFDGPNASNVRAKLLSEMASILNSRTDGAQKCPEKWLRSWQDWKSDIKKKAEISKQNQRLGASKSSELSQMEKELIEIIETAKNVQYSLDPLADHGCSQQIEIKIESAGHQADDVNEQSFEVPPPTPPSPHAQENIEPPRRGQKRKLEDETIEERMVNVVQEQATATSQIAFQLSRLADIGSQMLAMWVQSQSGNKANENDSNDDSD